MSCPICDHTMQNLGSPERRVFWCPRCGTLKTETGTNGAADVYVEVEMPFNLRRVVERANLAPGRVNRHQHTSVKVSFWVDQHGLELPRLEQVIFDQSGRRLS